MIKFHFFKQISSDSCLLVNTFDRTSKCENFTRSCRSYHFHTCFLLSSHLANCKLHWTKRASNYHYYNFRRLILERRVWLKASDGFCILLAQDKCPRWRAWFLYHFRLWLCCGAHLFRNYPLIFFELFALLSFSCDSFELSTHFNTKNLFKNAIQKRARLRNNRAP